MPMEDFARSCHKIDLWLKGEPFPPFEIEIYPTNKCNQRCIFCLQREEKYDYSKELSDARWLEIIEQGKELGVSSWVLMGGGEPLFRQDLARKIMRSIKKLQMMGNICTNGTLFTREWLEELVLLRWDIIMISIDSPDARTNDYLRGVKGSFASAIENIRYLKNLKERYNTSKPRLVFQTVLNKFNYDQMLEFHQLAFDLGMNGILIKPLETFTSFAKELKLSIEQKQEFLSRAKEVFSWAKNHQVDTNINLFRLNSKTDYEFINRKLCTYEHSLNPEYLKILCHEAWNKMSIMADGRVEPCAGVNRGMMIGDRNLKDVWLSDQFNQVREFLFKYKKLPECNLCGYGIPSTTREKLRFLGKKEEFPEMGIYPFEITN